MILICQLCGMKNQNQQNTISEILVFIVLALVSGILYLRHAKIVNWNLELVLAPFIAIALLAFGDKLILYFCIRPICSLWKITKRVFPLSKVNG